MKKIWVLIFILFGTMQAQEEQILVFLGNETGAGILFGKKFKSAFSVGYYNLLKHKFTEHKEVIKSTAESEYSHGITFSGEISYRVYSRKKLSADVGTGLKYRVLYDFARTYTAYNTTYRKSRMRATGFSALLRGNYLLNEKTSLFLQTDFWLTSNKDVIFGTRITPILELLVKAGIALKINAK